MTTALNLDQCFRPLANEGLFYELFCKNSSYVSGVSVCIFVALYVRMFVARANKVEGTMSLMLRNQ